MHPSIRASELRYKRSETAAPENRNNGVYDNMFAFAIDAMRFQVHRDLNMQASVHDEHMMQ